MQRLVLAILLVAVVIGVFAVGFKAVRRVAGDNHLPVAGATPMQRVSFVLLIALMAYVAIAGAS